MVNASYLFTKYIVTTLENIYGDDIFFITQLQLHSTENSNTVNNFSFPMRILKC